MFVKDIGILLFVTPAVVQQALGSLGQLQSYPKLQWLQSSWSERRQLIKAYSLELWLYSFVVIFCNLLCLFNFFAKHLSQRWQLQNG